MVPAAGAAAILVLFAILFRPAIDEPEPKLVRPGSEKPPHLDDGRRQVLAPSGLLEFARGFGRVHSCSITPIFLKRLRCNRWQFPRFCPDISRIETRALDEGVKDLQQPPCPFYHPIYAWVIDHEGKPLESNFLGQ